MQQAGMRSRFGIVRARLRTAWTQLQGWRRLSPRRRILYAAILAVVIIGGGAATYLRRAQPVATEEAMLQTAVVQRGSLVISATGSGTLTAPEKSLGFTGSGEMTVASVNVGAGDLVHQGQVLAEVDSTQAQEDYEDAQRAYAELTSVSGQAAALRKVADAQVQLQRAKGTLEYLINPDVMYWESEISGGQHKLETAKARLEKEPTDDVAKAAVAKAEAFLDFAQDKLIEAKKTYYDEYVPATFGIKEDLDVDTYNVPSDLEVKMAHLAVSDAEKTLQESQELYEALTIGVIPEETSNDSLLQIKKAKARLADAHANLDGCRITAPYSGTVMEVNIAGGDVVAMDGSGTSGNASSSGATTTAADPLLAALTGSEDSTTVSSSRSNSEALSAEGVIVLADTSQPYLEVNWNESDWPLLKVGEEVQITFDDRQGKVFSGRIAEIDREVHTSFESTTIRGEVSLDSPFSELGLPVGASASAEAIADRDNDALLIPIEALHKTSSGSYMVFVMEDGKVRLRAVEVGLMDESYAQITSGLEAGELVTTGLMKVE